MDTAILAVAKRSSLDWFICQAVAMINDRQTRAIKPINALLSAEGVSLVEIKESGFIGLSSNWQ
ncbi:hypothetical protein KUIN1_32880 [Pseudomonas sp. KUIN-1]|nr:hypothetical protein KUIN1_32880 [Pseudomonas sp. KUIN-1]